MNDLFLVYVNFVGVDYKGNFIYEFIFSETTKNVEGQDWDLYPSSGRPSVPNSEFIKTVGKLESELKLEVVQESDTFAVFDAVDGVIALAYENINNYETYPEHRLCFKFGETINEIQDKLYEKDLILKYNKEKHGKES